ncbi:unnamed protein product [Cylindrotheca closterium]|uniref:Exonuclease domain-containing protein n=1 Tax=Cylindrotheca closterium TaxID=2856 RepID=A0AAD2CSX9_9STRA|nr:unnamed protein product [Cylindrotheca closterium]
MASTTRAEATDDSSPTLGKKDKKKLKKLRNRVLKVQNEGERSGILTPKEWEEYRKLEDPDLTRDVGPSIRIRKRKEGINVEGAQHRDLLAWLLKQILFPEKNEAPVSKKRKREENQKETIHTVTLPPWVSIHNPGSISSITALEIHLPLSASLKLDRVESFLESSGGKGNICSTKIRTKWFQGHTPRSISDSLLYFNSKHNKKSKPENISKSIAEIVAELEGMLIQPLELEKEGYPGRVKGSKAHEYSSWTPTEKIDMATISLEDATALVEKIGFRIEEQEQDDDQLYISTDTTESSSQSDQSPRVFGMDCEMVRTSTGSELARITIVQFQSFQDGIMTTTTIMDELVKPDKAVLDYLTRHSGMTPKVLEPVTTRLSQIQVALLCFLRPNDILVGHSLENDLKATRLVHARVIDTALLFRASNKRTKFSLKHLAAYLLQKKIQAGSHCSEEDASMALELAIRRAWFGESFQVPSGDDRRSLFEGLSSARIMCAGPADWLHSHITSNANGTHALGYEGIAECKKAVLAWQSSQRKTDFIYSQWNLQNENDEKSLKELEDAVIEVIEKMSSTSILLISLQQNHHCAKKLLKQKRICKSHRATAGWSTEQEESLLDAVDDSRNGTVYWIGSATTEPSRDER